MMTTFVKKYNFAKFINFIRSIDGDFNNASIEYITDAIYDDTYDNNEDELSILTSLVSWMYWISLRQQ